MLFNLSLLKYIAKIPAKAVYIDLFLFSGIAVYIDIFHRGGIQIDIKVNKEKFISLCKDNIKREGLDDLLDWLNKSDFYIAPASTRFHGNVSGGLVQHSLNVYECLKKIVEAHSELSISLETITLCSLFHDICKANYYKVGTRNVKDEATGQWFKKEIYEVDEKFPIGHGEKSCIILQWFFKKLDVDELLAIRHHMGGFDSAVKGGDYSMSKAYDISKLSVMLHIADMEATYLLEEINE